MSKALSNLIHRFVAGQVQQLGIALRKPRTCRAAARSAILIRLFQFLPSVGGERGCRAQLPNATSTIAAFPFWYQLKNFVNGLVFLVRTKLDTGDQQGFG